MGAAAVHDAMRDVENTRRELIAVMRRHDDGWKAAYGRLRPVLDDRVERLTREATAWLELHGQPGQKDEFLRLLAELRSTTAHHQAKWPVLVIRPDDPEYLASVKKTDDAFAAVGAFVNRLPRSARGD